MTKVTLNKQHDYISLIAPNGRFTVSRSGYKATGGMDTTSLDNLVSFVES